MSVAWSSVVLAVVAAAVVFAVFDIAKTCFRAVDRLKVRRACRRGWDWPAFEREFAGYARSRSLKR